MQSGEIILLIVFLVNSSLLVGLSLPLCMGLVKPNPLYGFRTRRTMQDPAVWYPTNRVAGCWGIATGIATAAASLWAFLSGLGLPAAPLVALAVLVIGLGITLVHGMLVSRRSEGARTARK